MEHKVGDWVKLNDYVFDRDSIRVYAMKGEYGQVVEVCESSDGGIFSYLIKTEKHVLNVPARKVT